MGLGAACPVVSFAGTSIPGVTDVRVSVSADEIINDKTCDQPAVIGITSVRYRITVSSVGRSNLGTPGTTGTLSIGFSKAAQGFQPPTVAYADAMYIGSGLSASARDVATFEHEFSVIQGITGGGN